MISAMNKIQLAEKQCKDKFKKDKNDIRLQNKKHKKQYIRLKNSRSPQRV